MVDRAFNPDRWPKLGSDDASEAYDGYDDGAWRIPATTTYRGQGKVFVEKCSHYRMPLEVGGGTILASSQRNWKLGEPPQTDAGVYLDWSWIRKLGIIGHNIRCVGGYPALLMDWPDMGLPKDRELALAIAWTRRYLDAGKSVEVACIGGHGRTGTFIGCLLREYGFKAEAAIEVVRGVVCEECIETTPQEKFIASWEETK